MVVLAVRVESVDAGREFGTRWESRSVSCRALVKLA